MVRHLIELRADPLDCSNERMQRPIHWACTKGHVDIVNLLCLYKHQI